MIAAVEVARMTEGTNAIYSGLRVLLETVETREEAFAAIRTVLAATASDEGRRQRAHRIAVIATAQNIPLLAETMQEDQRWGDAHLAESLRIAAQRGLIGPIENPEGVAHLVSSLFIGRAVIDILRDDAADAAWLDATMAALEFHIPPKN